MHRATVQEDDPLTYMMHTHCELLKHMDKVIQLKDAIKQEDEQFLAACRQSLFPKLPFWDPGFDAYLPLVGSRFWRAPCMTNVIGYPGAPASLKCCAAQVCALEVVQEACTHQMFKWAF